MRISRTAMLAGSVLGVAVLVGCGGGAPVPEAVQPLPRVAALDSAQVNDAIGADDALGIDLLGAETAQGNGNVALSPVSVAIALQMVATGAGGSTATQIAKVLHLPDAAAAGPAGQVATARIASAAKFGSVTVRTANTLWTQQGKPLLPGFTQGLAVHFGISQHTADFAGDAETARQDINQLVSTQTEGKIPELFPSGTITDTTRMVLTNALYLAAAWQTPFNADQTAPATFTTASGGTVAVPTMSKELSASYASEPGYQVVTLPYRGGKLGFSVLLPDQGSSTSALLKTLRGNGLAAALRAATPNTVILSLPKFTVKSSVDLSDALSALGMPAAFTPQADFDGISTEHVFIQHVEHDAYVQLDENGTTAAAATGVSMGTAAIAAPPSSVHVDVNRPFLFAITDLGSGLPLFLGRISNPS